MKVKLKSCVHNRLQILLRRLILAVRKSIEGPEFVCFINFYYILMTKISPPPPSCTMTKLNKNENENSFLKFYLDFSAYSSFWAANQEKFV